METSDHIVSFTARKYLSKIKNKYLFFDILAFSRFTEDAQDLLQHSCRQLRRLLIVEYTLFKTITQPMQELTLDINRTNGFISNGMTSAAFMVSKLSCKILSKFQIE